MISDNEKKGTILLVDDSVLSLSITKNMLKDEYEVFTVQSGKGALKILLEKKLIPDLIILDIAMPNMNGWQLFNLIKAMHSLQEKPIAFLTALDTQEDIRQAREIGAADYITKPCEKPELLKRAKAMIGR